MGEAYVYAPSETDCSTIGLCGRLFPTDIDIHMVANGDLSLTMEHPVDQWGKYTYLCEEYQLKVDTPVRTTPEIASGSFVTVVEKWKVKSTATKDNRYLYSAKGEKSNKKLQLLPVGAEVVVVAKYEDDSDRWKVKYTYEVKSGSKVTQKTVTGYMAHDSNTLQMQETVNLPETNTGIEQVAPSWEISPQIFRIYKVEKKTDSVIVYALHSSYDLMKNLTDYEEDESKTLAEAAQGIFDNCLDAHGCTFQTNVGGEKAGFHFADKDPITALLDPDIGIISRWGAQLIRDNYSFVALDHAGTNRGLFFEYGKNVEGIEMTVDTSSVASAVRPVGEDKDGKRLYLTHSVLVTASGTIELSDTKGVVYGSAYHTYEGGVLVCTLPQERIFTLTGDDCKVDTKKGVTEAIVRERLLEQAIATLASSQSPTVSVSVDMAQLAYSREWDRYRDLHKVFLFDTAQVRYPQYGVLNMSVTVSEMNWDGIHDMPKGIVLGSVINASPSVASWQLSSVNGSKLVYGTVGGSAMAEGAVSSRVIQAEAVVAEHIAAGSVTANKIAAGAVSTDKLDANAVTAGKIAANAITAQKIAAGAVTTDKLDAGAVTADKILAGCITAALMAVGTITAESGIIANGAIGTAQIADGSITSAKVVSLNADVITAGTLSVHRLIIVGDDGLIYNINAAASGLAPEQLTDEEYREHLNGTVIVARSITAEQIAAQTITANEILSGTITSDKINCVELVASDAFIDQLNVQDITANRSLRITVNTLHGEASNAMSAAQEASNVTSDISRYMTFSAEGLRQSKPDSIYSTLIDDMGFHIDKDNAVGHVASFSSEGMTSDSIIIGSIKCRRSSKGGWVWQEVG